MSLQHIASHDVAFPPTEDDMTLAADMVSQPYPAVARTHRRHRPPGWAWIFLAGFLLWITTVVTTFTTGNVNLIPTIILLGSFLVPITFVSYAFGHADGVLTAQRIFTAFVCGGVLGVLGASVLEAALLRQPSVLGYVLREPPPRLRAGRAASRHLRTGSSSRRQP